MGDKVTYQGVTYSCRQAHTVHDPNWTPPNAPALWSRV
ncbi:carbohydrate-binding protein [Nocardia sp. MW-W600-9]